MPGVSLDDRYAILSNLGSENDDGQVGGVSDGSWAPQTPDERGAAIEAARPADAQPFSFDAFKNAVLNPVGEAKDKTLNEAGLLISAGGDPTSVYDSLPPATTPETHRLIDIGRGQAKGAEDVQRPVSTLVNEASQATTGKPYSESAVGQTPFVGGAVPFIGDMALNPVPEIGAGEKVEQGIGTLAERVAAREGVEKGEDQAARAAFNLEQAQKPPRPDVFEGTNQLRPPAETPEQIQARLEKTPGTFESGEPPEGTITPAMRQQDAQMHDRLAARLNGNPALQQWMQDHDLHLSSRDDVQQVARMWDSIPEHVRDTGVAPPKYDADTVGQMRGSLMARAQSSPEFADALTRMGVDPRTAPVADLERTAGLLLEGRFGEAALPRGAKPIINDTGEQSMTGVPSSVQEGFTSADQPRAGQPGSLYTRPTVAAPTEYDPRTGIQGSAAPVEDEGGKWLQPETQVPVNTKGETSEPGFQKVDQYTTAPGDMVPSSDKTPAEQLADLKARQEAGQRAAAANNPAMRVRGVPAQTQEDGSLLLEGGAPNKDYDNTKIGASDFISKTGQHWLLSDGKYVNADVSHEVQAPALLEAHGMPDWKEHYGSANEAMFKGAGAVRISTTPTHVYVEATPQITDAQLSALGQQVKARGINNVTYDIRTDKGLVSGSGWGDFVRTIHENKNTSPLPDVGGGSTSMATWVRQNPTLPQNVQDAAMDIPNMLARAIEPFRHAGPKMEGLAQGLAGDYEAAGTRASIDSLNGAEPWDARGWSNVAIRQEIGTALRKLDALEQSKGVAPTAWQQATRSWLESMKDHPSFSDAQAATAERMVNIVRDADHERATNVQALAGQMDAVKTFLDDALQSGQFVHKADIAEPFDPVSGKPPEGWKQIGSSDYYADPMTAAGMNHMFTGVDPKKFIDGSATYDDLGKLWGGEATTGLEKALKVIKEVKLGSPFHGPTTAFNVRRAIQSAGGEGGIIHPVEATKAVTSSIPYVVGGLPRLLKDHPEMADVMQRAAQESMNGMNFRNKGAAGFGQVFDMTATKTIADAVKKASVSGIVGGISGAGLGYKSSAGLPDDERRNRTLEGAALGALGGAAGNILVRKAIFQNYLPVQMLKGFDTLTKLGVSDKEAASLMNDAAGTPSLIAMGRSPGFQRALQVLMLGPQFDEGAIRTAVTHGGTSAKYVASMVMGLIGAQVLQNAIYRYGEGQDGGEQWKGRHFTWDSPGGGPKTALQLDVSPLFTKDERTHPDNAGRVGDRPVRVSIPGLGVAGSVGRDIATGSPADIATGHAGVAPSLIGSAGKDIILRRSPGDTAADVAASQASIGLGSLAGSGGTKSPGEPLADKRTALSVGAQFVGSRESEGAAQSPAIAESQRLNVQGSLPELGGKQGWPTAAKPGQEIQIPAPVQGRGAFTVPIRLTAQEAADYNKAMAAGVNEQFARNQDRYNKLPDKMPRPSDPQNLKDVTERTTQPVQRGTRVQMAKPSPEQVDPMQWSKAIALEKFAYEAHRRYTQQLYSKLYKSGQWSQRVKEAETAAGNKVGVQ